MAPTARAEDLRVYKAMYAVLKGVTYMAGALHWCSDDPVMAE
jgi:hypothetical protein